MKPRFGQGTRTTTLFSNQASGAGVASSFGCLGLRAVSMGEPISTSEAGRRGFFAIAIRLAAAIAGMPGWQTAITATRSPSWLRQLDHLDQIVGVVVEVELARAPAARRGRRPSR